MRKWSKCLDAGGLRRVRCRRSRPCKPTRKNASPTSAMVAARSDHMFGNWEDGTNYTSATSHMQERGLLERVNDRCSSDLEGVIR